MHFHLISGEHLYGASELDPIVPCSPYQFQISRVKNIGSNPIMYSNVGISDSTYCYFRSLQKRRRNYHHIMLISHSSIIGGEYRYPGTTTISL
jgi:hypothetical protein